MTKHKVAQSSSMAVVAATAIISTLNENAKCSAQPVGLFWTTRLNNQYSFLN